MLYVEKNVKQKWTEMARSLQTSLILSFCSLRCRNRETQRCYWLEHDLIRRLINSYTFFLNWWLSPSLKCLRELLYKRWCLPHNFCQYPQVRFLPSVSLQLLVRRTYIYPKGPRWAGYRFGVPSAQCYSLCRRNCPEEEKAATSYNHTGTPFQYFTGNTTPHFIFIL